MFRLQNELLDTWREHRAALARRARLAAVDAAVLDTVGLATRAGPDRGTRVERTGLTRPWTAWTSCCWSSPPRWCRSPGCSRPRTRRSPWSRRPGWRRWPATAGAAPRRCCTITEDRPRYTNLLLLLRVGAEITATVMVATVALSTWGFQPWVGVVRGRRHGGGHATSRSACCRAPSAASTRTPSVSSRPGRPRALAKVLSPIAVAADPDRQRDHSRPGLPRGPVLLGHRAARAGRHRRQPRRRRGDRARDAAERLRSRATPSSAR